MCEMTLPTSSPILGLKKPPSRSVSLPLSVLSHLKTRFLGAGLPHLPDFDAQVQDIVIGVIFIRAINHCHRRGFQAF